LLLLLQALSCFCLASAPLEARVCAAVLWGWVVQELLPVCQSAAARGHLLGTACAVHRVGVCCLPYAGNCHVGLHSPTNTLTGSLAGGVLVAGFPHVPANSQLASWCGSRRASCAPAARSVAQSALIAPRPLPRSCSTHTCCLPLPPLPGLRFAAGCQWVNGTGGFAGQAQHVLALFLQLPVLSVAAAAVACRVPAVCSTGTARAQARFWCTALAS
jgi:hypothetical protein